MRQKFRANNIELIDEDRGCRYVLDMEYDAALEFDKKLSLDVNRVTVVEAQTRVFPVKKGSLVTNEPKWVDVLFEVDKKLFNDYVFFQYDTELHELCADHWQDARFAKSEE